MPRVLRAIREGFEFGLAALAGALVAVVATGLEGEGADTVWAVPAKAQATLELLPLGVRLGAANPGPLALMRARLRPRVLAHLLASRIDIPDDTSDEELRDWASMVLESLEDPAFVDTIAQSETERELFRAAAYVAAEL